MSLSAYNRGSKLVATQIQRNYDNSPCGQAQASADLSKAFERIEELELYCKNANSFFIDVTTEPFLGGLVSAYIRKRYQKKQHLKKLNAMLAECGYAHAQWVDVDTRDLMTYSAACHRKAKAWYLLLDYLNPPPTLTLPFKTPLHLNQ